MLSTTDDGVSVEIEARETFIILRLMRIRFPRSARLMAHDLADSMRTANFDYSVFDRYGEIDVRRSFVYICLFE